jgi:hypothetical protein
VRLYLEAHPEWREATVGLAFTEIESLFRDVDRLSNRFAGLNSYADGPRPDLDKAIEVLQLELMRLVRYWSEPLDEAKDA